MAYAELLVIKGDSLLKIPSDMSLKYAVLVPDIVDSITRIKNLDIQADLDVCVLGAGSLGNICAQIIRMYRSHVIVVDNNLQRLSLLHKLDVDTLSCTHDFSIYDHVISQDGMHKAGDRISSNYRDDRSLHFIPVELPNLSNMVEFNTAISLIRRGSIVLQDHVDTVFGLEDFEEAWLAEERQDSLNVLLNPNKELASI